MDLTPIGFKIIRIWPPGFKNLAKSTPRDPKSNPKCIPEATLLQRMPSDLDFLKIWWFVDPQIHPKILQKNIRKRPRKTIAFHWRLFLDLGYLGTQNTPKIDLRRCKADFRKSLFYIGKTYVFEAWALWKTPFLPLETHPRKLISKNMIFNWFWPRFGPPKRIGKRSETRLVFRRYANCSQVVANQRGPPLYSYVFRYSYD